MVGTLPEAVAVVGAGTMGSGIGLSFALAGCEVRVTARRPASLDAGRGRVEASLELLTANGRCDAGQASEAAARMAFTTDLDAAVIGAGLVVETISEELEAKRDVLARAERVAGEDAVLATDTSSLSLVALGDVLARPERFAGFHWFNPPELIELVEVVSGPRTAPATAAALIGWARELGKAPVHVRRDVPGFIVNRLQYALVREAYALVGAGICTYAEVDDAVKSSLGPRWSAIGPFETFDLAGLDVHLAVAEQLFPDLDTSTEPPADVRELVAQGALGCKSGRGLYGDYLDDEITALVERRAAVLAGLARLRGNLTPRDEPLE
jgi:3-hydroxybutyryl-CoA dehydrogenase